jgi:hypothetical protein
MELVFLPHSFVGRLPRVVVKGSLPAHKVIFKLPLVESPVRKSQFAFALLLAVDDITLVSSTVLILKSSVSHVFHTFLQLFHLHLNLLFHYLFGLPH